MNNKPEKKEKSAQMRTVYVTLALSLVIMAVLIALSGAFRKSDKGAVESYATEIIVEVPDIDVMAPYNEHTVTESETQKTTEEMTTETTTEKPVDAVPTLPEFTSPVSGYLMKVHSIDVPIFSATMNDFRTHIGVDITASVGEDVHAAAPGVIKDIWEDPMEGNCVSISHEGGGETIYKNISATLADNIAVGYTVSAGEVIASVGDTSMVELADDSHLHFELIIDGMHVDPAKYIEFPESDMGYEG